jgi:hypothetical protein
VAKAEITIAWLPLRAAAGYVASYLGCAEESIRLRIDRKVEARRVRARGVTSEGYPVSLLPASWPEIDWGAESLKLEPTNAALRAQLAKAEIQLSYEVTNVELCYADLVATELLTTTALGRARWSAAEALAWMIIGVPLRLKEWAGLPELGDGMEQAGIDLASAIGEDHVLAWGSLNPLGPMEQMPGGDLRIPGFVWVVYPDGTLGTSPPGRLAVFRTAQYEQGLKEERCWYRIEVDSAVRQVFPRPLRVERRMLDEAEQLYAGGGFKPAAPPPAARKLSGKEWVPVAHKRRPDELLAMGITGASEALVEESKTAPDCAKPLTVRYIEKLLRKLGVFKKAYRGLHKPRLK